MSWPEALVLMVFFVAAAAIVWAMAWSYKEDK